jgi:hypothetical protein
VKNITVSVPDDVYRGARIEAAERDTSVSALVRNYLESLSEQSDDFERRRRMQKEVVASIRRFRGGDRVSRAEVHGRYAIR